MEGIANFADDFLGGLRIVAYSLVIGGLAWIWAMLRLCPTLGQTPQALREAFRLSRFGAWSLALVLGVKLLVKAWVIAGALGAWPGFSYLGTMQFQAGLLQGLLALTIARVIPLVAAEPRAREWPQMLALLVFATVASGAWMVHAVGRFEHRLPLMVSTLVHQTGAALWFGGVAQLLLMWRMKQRGKLDERLCGALVRRFFPVGLCAVVVLLATGLPMAKIYIHDWTGLVGTGYGSLLLVKICLLAMALGFASLNRRAGSRILHDEWLLRRVPYYVEAESFVLVTALFVAATLSSQPPAVDIQHLHAGLAEVWEMFSPKAPRLSSPSHAELLAGEAGRLAIIGKVPSPAATHWSDFNHNVSGIFLIGMALLALAGYVRGWRWARYWPVGFILLGVFLFFRSDAETWPLGPIGFWESTFGNGEVLQHRLATLLALVLGVLEIRARRDGGQSRLRYLFPILCAFGGILLLTHSHAEFEARSEYLIQVTHTVMGLCAVVMASSRWLELRLEPPVAVRAGMVSVSAMLLIGMALLFYREPLY